MKRNKQVIKGNVTGSGHGNPIFRHGGRVPVANIPRKPVLPRQARRFLRQGGVQIVWPKWTRLSDPLYVLFQKNGFLAIEA